MQSSHARHATPGSPSELAQLLLFHSQQRPSMRDGALARGAPRRTLHVEFTGWLPRRPAAAERLARNENEQQYDNTKDNVQIQPEYRSGPRARAERSPGGLLRKPR